MSFGKGSSGGSTSYIPTLSPEQNAMIAAQTKFYTGVMGPQYEQYAKGLTDLYNKQAGGATAAAQNLAGTAAQAQQALGSTGESALRTGIGGLENLFSKDYENQQVQAALMPAQAQYAQNLAGQQAQFGGTGNLGSARQALAGQQLAGATQAAQMQTAAGVQQQIAAQRAAAANQLAQFGQGGLGQAIGAAGQGVTASQLPMNFLSQYGQAMGLVPGATYTPNFSGTQGYNSNTQGNTSNYGIKI
jgi:hypothetical protein